MSELWTHLILSSCTILIWQPWSLLHFILSLLGVANEPSFTQKASSRLIRKILNSCRDTSRQGVDQRGMQDLIPAVLYPLLNLPNTRSGSARDATGKNMHLKKFQVCLYCTSFTCLAFEQLYIWSYFQVSQRLKKSSLLLPLLTLWFTIQLQMKERLSQRSAILWRLMRASLKAIWWYGEWQRRKGPLGDQPEMETN